MKMTFLKTLLRTILILVGVAFIGFLIVVDVVDRGQYYSRYIPEDELEEFYLYKTPAQQKEAFQENFGSGKYRFPRDEVNKVKLLKNDFLISRLTSTTVSEKDKNRLLEFFNNPDNFDWSETTWDIKESEYILRFYNSGNKEIGKIWLCLEGCGMTKSEPFSPNMKYGAMSSIGKARLKTILDRI
ncbi:hypothetical protein JCM19314_60 [Nonlabens ulvanivorans]|uniref:Uncharacterized protein n=1 Tax=Nonlabens ulvanivorans TaxID=906888 RepID=A0A090QGB5_NONUL|nr:hypothetical protein JCM19314_60 [Nonlabens ulvanivorans]